MALDLKKIKKISAQVQRSLFREANAISTGLFKTQFRGSGLQFREHQVYEPGDDVRFIDWKLSAKMRRTYIKTFEEERNVEVNIVIDLTPSMMMGFKDVSKVQAAMEIAAMIGMIAARTGDKVKIFLLSNELQESRKCSGQELIVTLISLMQKMHLFNAAGQIDRDYDIQSSSETQRTTLLKRLLSSKKQVLLISDFSEIESGKIINFLGRRNFHPVKLTIPLDDALNLPYSLTTKFKNKTIYSYKKMMEKPPLSTEEKRILKIDLSKSYLNDFINLMRRKT